MGWDMEIPIVGFPMYIEELSTDFAGLFKQDRQMDQFKRLMTGFVIAERNTIAHVNGLFTYHTDQSNLNRFVTRTDWSSMEMNRIKIGMINEVEDDGVVVLDDYTVEKYGKEIYGTDWHYDHEKGRKIWGMQIADCIFSGKGIHPLLATVYVKEDSRWLKDDFKTKIEIQKEHLTQLVDMNLNFPCVLIDSWYFCKELTEHIESLEKDWVAQSKSNRLIRSRGKWVRLDIFAKDVIHRTNFRVIKLGDETYMMKAFTVKMKGMGRVRLLISFNKHGNFHFYVSNRLDWKELAIATRYSRRWDIEVWHREGKGSYGLEDCQLRCDEAVSRYLTLSALAANLLEIASMLSPVYASLTKRGCTPEMKHRWVLVEMVGQLISSASKIGDKEVKKIIEGILFPYKSTVIERKAG
jgi:hypothetical protein